MPTQLDIDWNQAPTRFVAYYRVSTARQGVSGLGLDAQREAVARATAAGEVVAEYTEVESGKRKDRPELLKALAEAKRQKAVLVIAKLDRLARNVAFIANLMEARVKFVALDIPQATDFTLHIMAAVAEQEAKMISKRTIDALAAAKARGVKLGSPVDTSEQARAVLSKRAEARREQYRPIVADLRKRGINTLAGIADALNARGIKTPRGGEWSATQVQRLGA